MGLFGTSTFSTRRRFKFETALQEVDVEDSVLNCSTAQTLCRIPLSAPVTTTSRGGSLKTWREGFIIRLKLRNDVVGVGEVHFPFLGSIILPVLGDRQRSRNYLARPPQPFSFVFIWSSVSVSFIKVSYCRSSYFCCSRHIVQQTRISML